ncbi:BREX system ATP-binding protein BrxD [Lamprobacter modestohalophilus]|uniref:BREX system ATP-binding protein BrxD n=1 Tax=Lamprobacter modestohalophilus TaxID=1064514 RepID=UPI002ADEDD14|nr:BREX system ATP-binding protein BrxD [Lamprobacter modestohalophilus]MEA1048442.1 BREX system ATP-binding protein BrxD [Lamprobacter modestohalophilus]
MTTLTKADLAHLFEALRKGLVPERGLEAFAIGIDKQRGEMRRQLDLASSGEGTVKFLRGGYGCGKTFMARLSLLDAQAMGFATSFVVVSDNDLRFQRFDDVYRKVMTELATNLCPRGALGDILDRWIGQVEEALVAAGQSEDAPDFDDRVRRRLDEDLAAATGGQAPADFVRVIQTIFDLKQAGDTANAGALISWLSGSGNVAASAKKAAGIKGDIESRNALDYLRGVLEIVKAAGYRGLAIVIDEAETILRMRRDSRHKSLNGIRQIADVAGSYPGLLWVFTGTPEFFDSRQGVAGLAPLHDRIRFLKQGRFASLRQAQLELTPFSADRLRSVATRLRELFPASDPMRLEARISDAFIDRLVAEVTAGFKGDVGIVPRQFMREFVTQMDLVDEQADYAPARDYGFSATPLGSEEAQVLYGAPSPPIERSELDADDDLVPAEDVW